MRRWLATPYYGALLAPVWLIVRDVLLAIAGGAAAVIALRRIRRG